MTVIFLMLLGILLWQLYMPGSALRYYNCKLGRMKPHGSATFRFIPKRNIYVVSLTLRFERFNFCHGDLAPVLFYCGTAYNKEPSCALWLVFLFVLTNQIKKQKPIQNPGKHQILGVLRKQLMVFAKSSILDVCQSSEYSSKVNDNLYKIFQEEFNSFMTEVPII